MARYQRCQKLKLLTQITNNTMAIRKIADVGNYTIKLDEKRHELAVCAKSSQWSVRFGASHVMFGSILQFTKVEGSAKYLEMLFSSWFITTQGLLDKDALEGILGVMTSQIERWNSQYAQMVVSKEEDDKILAEETMRVESEEEGKEG